MSATGGPHSDPQTHLDTDPVNDPAREGDADEGLASDEEPDRGSDPHSEGASSSRPSTDA